MSDKELEKLIEPIIDIYNSLELDIIKDIASRFDNYDTIGGTLEWRLKKLDEVGLLNKSVTKLINKYSKKTEDEIKQMLYDAQNGVFNIPYYQKAYEKGIITVDPLKALKSDAFLNILNNTYKEVNETFRLIHTKALESTKKAYINVLNEAFVSVSTGMYDYNTAINKALTQMAENGIKGASYERKDGTIVRYSLQGTIRRDIVSAIIQTACASSMTACNELGAEYVEVTSHLGARTGDGKNPITNHAHWQGKIYKLNGSDSKYKNFYEETGYGDILGLGGVNCRHNFYPFFPGIDKPSAIQYDEEENKKEYEKRQQKKRLEREKQKYQRIKEIAVYNNDEKVAKETNSKIKKINVELNKISWFDKLSFEQKNDIKEYISSGSYKINETLYNNRTLTKEQIRFRDSLDSALMKAPKYNGYVNRSIEINNKEQLKHIFSIFDNEKGIGNWGSYISSSKGIYDDKMKLQFKIKSINGRDLSSLNDEGGGEILFERKTKFKYVDYHKENDKIYVEWEEVE